MKNIYILFLTVAFGLSVQFSNAQQSPTYSNYYYNQVLINPAHAGFLPETDITVSQTGHFNAIEGSPRTMTATISGSLPNNKVGIAAGVTRDQIGVSKVTRAFASYAYKITFKDQDPKAPWWNHKPSAFTMGLTAGVLQFNEDLLQLGIQNDPNFANNINEALPTFDFGVLLVHDDLHLGFSAQNLFADGFAEDANLQVENPFYFYGGYDLYTGYMRSVRIQPTVLAKVANGAPAQIDFNVSVNYKNLIEGGVGYRTSAAFNLFAGVYLMDHLRIAYTLDVMTSNTPLNNPQGIVLSYRFGKGFTDRQIRTDNYYRLFNRR